MKDDVQRTLSRGIEWLVRQQGADGGWHSATYGQLKEGAGITALVLDALGHAPAAVQQRHLPAIKRGYAFLDPGLARAQTIASPDGTLDFPTYAAALWLTGRRRLNLAISGEQGELVVKYLLGAQVGLGRGFAADSPSTGGWDFLGPGDAQGITTGTNISVSRYVLEALRVAVDGGGEAAANDAQQNDAQQAAIGQAVEPGKAYVLRCQTAAGGFAFTCEPASLSNKAAYHDDKLVEPRPYGTATCDGIRALLACGLRPTDEAVAKALGWLAERPALEVVPGFEGLPLEVGWQRGLVYYYYAGLGAVLRHLPAGEAGARQRALAEHLASMQHQDGYWINKSDRMRENDPLIATALAVTALGACLQA